jgi:hypothetical protein
MGVSVKRDWKDRPRSDEGTMQLAARRWRIRPGPPRSAGQSRMTGNSLAGSTQAAKRSTCSTPF